MSIWPILFVETYRMDLVSQRINSLFKLNDGSLQGFEWFRWNSLFVGTAKLYDSRKCACMDNIKCHSYLNLNMHSGLLTNFFWYIYLYLPQTWIPYKDYNSYPQIKIKCKKQFFFMAFWLPGYFTAVHYDVE